MDIKFLPKNFFKKNPPERLSAVQLAYFSMTDGMEEHLEAEVFNIVQQNMDTQRLEKIQREKEDIQHLIHGEDFVRFMRGNYDITNRNTLCKRVLSMQDEVVPFLLRRFRTSMQDLFIETTVYILAHAEQTYVDQLKKIYPEIRNPYAQSMACLVFGVHKQEDTLPLLLSEYERLKQEYPDESFVTVKPGGGLLECSYREKISP